MRGIGTYLMAELETPWTGTGPPRKCGVIDGARASEEYRTARFGEETLLRDGIGVCIARGTDHRGAAPCPARREARIVRACFPSNWGKPLLGISVNSDERIDSLSC